MSYNRKYIGARYIPKFADDVEWDINNTYEPLTIVLYNNDTYTSRQYVPANIQINNTDYWVKTADFNASLQILEDEVQAIDDKYDAKFPVSVEDGGTGLTSYAGSSLIQTNSTGTAFVTITPEQLINEFGNTPVNRAIADQNGDVIDETYYTKNIIKLNNYTDVFQRVNPDVSIVDFEGFIEGSNLHIHVVFTYYNLINSYTGPFIFETKPEYCPVMETQQLQFSMGSRQLLSGVASPISNQNYGLIEMKNLSATSISANTYIHTYLTYTFEDRSA